MKAELLKALEIMDSIDSGAQAVVGIHQLHIHLTLIAQTILLGAVLLSSICFEAHLIIRLQRVFHGTQLGGQGDIECVGITEVEIASTQTLLQIALLRSAGKIPAHFDVHVLAALLFAIVVKVVEDFIIRIADGIEFVVPEVSVADSQTALIWSHLDIFSVEEDLVLGILVGGAIEHHIY